MRDYSLITPDGWTFEFDSKYWTVDFGIPDGFGLPPIEHVTQKQFKQPGELLQDIHIGARLVTITGGINGDCLEELHSLRKRLFSALRWNRTNDDPPLPSQLRYRLNNKAAYLNCYYAGDVIANVGTDEKQQTIGIKLIAYDPLWYGEADAKVLSLYQNLTVNYLIGKLGRTWNDFNGAGTDEIYGILFGPDGDSIYVCGKFLNLAGIANADYAAKYTISTDTWSALGTGPGAQCQSIALGLNGLIYVTTTTGVLFWDGISWIDLSPVAANGVVYAIAFVSTGSGMDIYVAGSFTTINGVAANRCAKYSGGAWSALGTGFDAAALQVVSAPDGTIYFGGQFTTGNGVATGQIAKWDGATFASVGGNAYNGAVRALALASDGLLYAGGDFTTVNGISASYIATWNGTTWQALGSGLNNSVYVINISSLGEVYAGGVFTSAGDLSLADCIAKWNGSSWSQLDVDLPGGATIKAIQTDGTDIVLSFDTTGTARVSGNTSAIAMNGDERTCPILTFTGPGVLQWIESIDTDKKIILNLTLTYGEVVTIDLTPRVKTLTSSSRGDLLPYAALLPLSDFGSFALEPDPIAPLGVNTLNVLMTGTTPVEQNDNNNQLSNWVNITGVTYLNTDSSGRMYVSIIADGGGFYHVALYKDSARTELVGHTASYNGAGAKAIVADNASGLGGTVTVDAVTAADADIIVYFATGKIEWTDAYLSVDANVGV